VAAGFLLANRKRGEKARDQDGSDDFGALHNCRLCDLNNGEPFRVSEGFFTSQPEPSFWGNGQPCVPSRNPPQSCPA